MSKGAVYERQTQVVLTGGWNVLPPGDLISDAEALQCENWRVNAAGNLKSRYGNGGAVYSPGPVMSLCQVKGAGTRRYSAAYNGHLWRNGSDLGGFATAGERIGMVSYQGFLWAMSRSNQKKDNGTDLLTWSTAPPANPVVTTHVAAGSLVDTKVYTYWITYTNIVDQQESPSNPAGVNGPVVVAPDQAMDIASPTDPADPQRTHWNVYRSGNTLQDTLRLNRVPILLGTDFVDNGDVAELLDDYSVTQLGIALDPDSAGPPAGNGLAGPYYDRLLAWGVLNHPNRLYWSGLLQPYNFPGSDLDEGNHVDIGELGEEIIGVTIRPRTAIVYKDSSIWRLLGDPGDLSGGLEPITRDIGAIGGSGIISVGGTDYFQSKEGVYSFNGERATKATGKLDPLFRGEFLEPVGPAFSSLPQLNVDEAALERNCIAHRKGRLYFFYCGGTATLPTRGIATEIGSGAIGADTRAVSAILDEGKGLLLASIGDDVVSIEEGFDDGGAPIPLAYLTRYKNQDAPDNLKTYVDVVIEHNTGGATLGVSAYYNNGVGPIPPQLAGISEFLGNLTSIEKTTTTFQLDTATAHLGVTAKNIALNIAGDADDGAAASIYKILLHYFIEPRDSKTWDSDETDLGDTHVKALYELELDIFAAGTVAWEVSTNITAGLAAGVMASRQTGSFGATTTRVPLRIPLTSPVDGRLARVTLKSDDSTFRLYGARIRIRPYGEYLEAAEVWQTVELNLGA